MVLNLNFKPLPNLFCFSSFKYISNLPLVWSVILLLSYYYFIRDFFFLTSFKLKIKQGFKMEKNWESPFIPCHLTFKKFTNFTQFHAINHTTIKQSINLSIYYNIPKFRILGCYKCCTCITISSPNQCTYTIYHCIGCVGDTRDSLLFGCRVV